MLMTVTVVAVNGWIWLLVVVGLGMYYDIVDCMPLSIFWILPSALTQRVFFFVIVFAEFPFIDDFHSFLESLIRRYHQTGEGLGKFALVSPRSGGHEIVSTSRPRNVHMKYSAASFECMAHDAQTLDAPKPRAVHLAYREPYAALEISAVHHVRLLGIASPLSALSLRGSCSSFEASGKVLKSERMTWFHSPFFVASVTLHRSGRSEKGVSGNEREWW